MYSNEIRLDKATPTLFIALGGSGAEIAINLRRRILTHEWGSDNKRFNISSLDEFPLAQFIYYDLDASTVSPDMFSTDERIISNLDLDKYFSINDQLNRYPHIAEWFPLTRKKVLEFCIDPSKGAAQIRALSRLYFFDKYVVLKSMIEDKINLLLSNISNKASLERLGIQMESGSLRVVVIASTAGGTGSGSFIDMGYLAKLLSKKQLLGAKVDLCLLLPGCFTSGFPSRKEANTYASLMELETCMSQGNQFVKRWSVNEYDDLPSTPYDDVFLFDNGNLANKNKEKAADLFDMVADSLFDDFIPSDFSGRKNAIRVCHTQYKVGSFSLPVDHMKYGSMKITYSKSYSAFGQSIIEAKLDQLQDEIVYEKIADTPLIKMLEKMNISARRSLFQNCMEFAMPWVEANVSLILGDNTNQYNCLIGVDCAKLFEQKFGEEFKSVIPTQTGISPRLISFCESGIPEKLICYVELSGIPLAALTQLPHWRKSYEEENKKIPVHIHKDKSIFVHPLAPSSSELARLAEHFKLYIQGIILGVLNLRIDDTEERLYCLTVSGEELSIGNERTIRMEGIASEHLMYLQKKVTDAINRIKTPAQYAGLVVLYDFYSQCVYPFAILRDEGVNSEVEGFANVMCAILGDESRKVLSEASDIDHSKLFARLKDKLAIWTDEIKGSENDVYPNEVDKSHMPKRILKSEFFQTGWLEQHISIMTPEPPPLPEIPVYVAVNGQQTGPFNMSTLRQMVKLGQLTGNSLVWMQGMEKWKVASTVTYITPVFNAIPSLDDKIQPID